MIQILWSSVTIRYYKIQAGLVFPALLSFRTNAIGCPETAVELQPITVILLGFFLPPILFR